MVETRDSGQTAEASLDRHRPPDPESDAETAYHWTVYARRRDRERFETRNIANRIMGVPRERWAIWRGLA